MEINVQISDRVYHRLVTAGGRIQGTIGLVNTREGNFNEHIRHTDGDTNRTKYIRLRHGRVSVNEQRVRLNLTIALDEADIIPAEAIEDESRQAGGFVDEILENIERYH